MTRFCITEILKIIFVMIVTAAQRATSKGSACRRLIIAAVDSVLHSKQDFQ